LVKFEKSHKTLDENEKKKKNPLLPTTFINRFEKHFGTFRGGGGKKPIVSMPKCWKYDYICNRKEHLQLP
jgi:hypothetical protein